MMTSIKLFSFIIILLYKFNGNECQYDLNVDKNSVWWEKMVLYQIYPRSFKDSDGDGIGDLNGIISKLSHLKMSGIKATWLSPIFKSPMVDFGYDISNFTQIQNEYGTMEDFEKLLNEANKLGIKIIMDLVPNHSSDQCEWFIKSVNREPGYEDFYIWNDGKVDENGSRIPPNNWNSLFYGPAWTWNEKRQQYYLHQFASAQPDFNYRNPKVIETMDNVIKFWLDKGIAGYRVDAVPFLYEVEDLRDEPETGLEKDPKSYDFTYHYYTKDLPETYDMIYHWRELLDNYTIENGGETRIIFVEAYANITFTMDYYESSNGVKGAQFPFNFLLITDINANSDARDFLYIIQKWLAYMPLNGTANWVLSNHDQKRVGTRFGKERIDAMNMLIMTLPGVAVSYNGDEIGMLNYDGITWEETQDPQACNTNKDVYQKYTRDPERTPFQWDSTENAGFTSGPKTWIPINPNYKELNLQAQIEQEHSHYNLYKYLVSLRELPTLKYGSFMPLALNRNVFAYKRELKDHTTLIVAMNLKSTDEVVDLSVFGGLPEKLFVVAAGSTSMYKEGYYIDTKNAYLGAYESLILKGETFDFRQRREIIKTLLKAGNVLLVGMLMFKLWNNKWTKLSLYPKNI